MLRWGLFAILMILPWVATYAGSLTATYFNIKTERTKGIMLGFAGGIMIAASVWSLIIPAFDEAGVDAFGGIIVTLGFALGCALMIVLDKVIPHQHIGGDKPEGMHTASVSKPMLLVMAVALHNIPEGIALGVVIAAAMGDTSMTWNGAVMFGLGLALQNYPEGFAVIFPLKTAGVSRKKCNIIGFLTSLAEPFAAVVGLVLATSLSSLGRVAMPLMLAIAAGAMVFIVVEELIPESQADKDSHAATYGFIAGFWIMALMGIIGIG